jgi:hypothetical protein
VGGGGWRAGGRLARAVTDGHLEISDRARGRHPNLGGPAGRNPLPRLLSDGLAGIEQQQGFRLPAGTNLVRLWYVCYYH